jgi:beta-lactamase class A
MPKNPTPILLAAWAASAFAQTPLQRQIAAIAADARGKVSVACSLPGTALDCDRNAHAHPPMLSVFKTPLAVTVLHLVEQGKLDLQQPLRFRAGDRILPQTVSPLQDRYPQAEVDVPLGELLMLSVLESDNVAADILLRTVGGPAVVGRYMKSIGIRGFHLQDDEAALHADASAEYRNWFEPAAAVALLRQLSDHPPLRPEHAALLLDWMRNTPRGPARIKGLLPEETVVMHKPGSSGTEHGITHAWNDIGLIVLPDGRRLAIAIFITDSAADEATRDSVSARIAKAVYDAAVNSSK